MEVPPEYVQRDVDAGGSGVRARVAAAARRGGFVLLVGGSSVGKTRCAVEAVRALLPEWWLVQPTEVDGAYSSGPADARRGHLFLNVQGYPDEQAAYDGAIAAATTVLNAFIQHSGGYDGCTAASSRLPPVITSEVISS